MTTFILELKTRNEELFYFGLICFFLAVLFFIFTRVTSTQVMGVNAWWKPFKFASSIAIYSWTMAWLIAYLHSFNQQRFAWIVVILLGFEIIYIAVQAARGQLSHYNLSTPLYRNVYQLMAIAATVVTVYTAYVGFLFFQHPFPQLELYYLWSIRLGLVLFVVFSLEGFVMGARLSHTVGAPDGSLGLLIVNWSVKHGDLRIAHFVGMHALQVLPLVSFYLLQSTGLTILAGLLYAALATFVLVVALQGKLILKYNNYETKTMAG